MSFLQDGVSLLGTRTFWATVVTGIIWTIQRFGIDTHAIDQNSVVSFALDVVGALSMTSIVVARYFAKEKVVSVLPKKG